MSADLLDLPFAIQVALGSGYTAYLVAFSGLRQHHTPTDVIFRTLVFGLVASGVMKVLARHGFGEVGSAGLAFIASVITGALWRAFIGRRAKQLLRKLLVSWADDLPSAWLSITAERTDLRPSQIVVELDDGRLLMCDDTRRFGKAPFEMGVFGLDGSIAMYVTSERRPTGEWIDCAGVLHEKEGANITYISPAKIRRVELRHWQDKKTRKLPRWFRRLRWWNLRRRSRRGNAGLN